MTISYTTFQDIIDHGIDYLGGNPSDQVKRDCIRAALEQYRDLVNVHNWTYLYTQGRIVTSAAFTGDTDEATITYTHSGGTYDRMVTLSGAIWPDWASNGFLRIGEAAYRVEERKSATVVTLTDTLNPGDDLPAGTRFMIYRDTYLLPDDYVAQDQALYERNFASMCYRHPREWLFDTRYVISQGEPSFFTITGDRAYPGRLVMRVFPWPSEAKSIDFIYKRRPRPLLTMREATGKITVTQGRNVVTGIGTVFSPKHVGSVIRISATAKPPLSLIMAGPADPQSAFESIVASYVSPTSVALQDPLDASYTAVGYVISDSIDVEPGAMLNAYHRGVEMHLGMNRTLKDKPSAAKQYLVALNEAKAADSRSFMGRSVGDTGTIRRRLRDMPIGPDEP
ncbi:hypothetical protein SAMN05444166_4229 [Singulisphaera sp. GP187]|uniref:hypothetical protein n=1 Tax=Singulisphaera sp. GP187 TaxID=1882752 RepID=UPI0009284A26|nr:hypothetical protein [Singulisphaera sp. GP187]SIO37942.1 hypothetical protein SAMN05444166_4229 [Singulisphaera sp. GP187]